MRVHLLLVSAACGLCLGAMAAIAKSADIEVNKEGVRVRTGATASGPIVRCKDLTGLKVTNAADESLGKIEDLVIDPKAGKIHYAVVSFGGVFGMGGKYFAVPWDKLAFVAKGKTSSGTEREAFCLLDVSKSALKNAPGFDKDNWPDFVDANWTATIKRFYGSPRDAESEQKGASLKRSCPTRRQSLRMSAACKTCHAHHGA